MFHHAKDSPQLLARSAGLLYLAVVPLGIFSLLYVPAQIIAPGNAAATVANMIERETLFRLGMASDMLAGIIMILVVGALARLLRPVSESATWLMVGLLLVAVPIAMLGHAFQLAALLLVSGSSYLEVFTSEQLHALALWSLRMHGYGTNIAFIFWGLWLVPLGYLVFRSRFLPRVLGVLLVIAGAGYVGGSFASILGHSTSIGLVTGWGEVVFLLWLLLKGVDVERWRQTITTSS